MDPYVAPCHIGEWGCPEWTTVMVIVVWEVGRVAACDFFFSCIVLTGVVQEKQGDRMSSKPCVEKPIE